MTTPVLPEEAYAVALLDLPEMWPVRLGAMLLQRRASDPTPAPSLFSTPQPTGPARAPSMIWRRVCAGRAETCMDEVRLRTGVDKASLAAMWARVASGVDVARNWGRYVRAGVRVDLLGRSGYPAELATTDGAPYVVFRSGPALDLAGPRVAVIGTRDATDVGRDIARELGAGLAAAGVRVVSGLARGIDAAAHQGAISAAGAPPIGVVAGGFDVPYPSRNRVLWRQVEAVGAMVSEWTLGTRSQGWRFPARNRIIAGLADIVVVVESAATGGSMLTAEMAMESGRNVMVVPGSLRSPVSVGTNELLRLGARPVTSVLDILDDLDLSGVHTTPPSAERPDLDRTESSVLEAVSWEPTSTDKVVARTGLEPAVVATVLAHLEMDGLVTGDGLGWQLVGSVRGQRPPRS